MLNTCRICGYLDENLMPWGEDEKTPSFEICPCCNVEFGYEDSNNKSIFRYREKWINSEKFNSESKYLKQLNNISNQFL